MSDEISACPVDHCSDTDITSTMGKRKRPRPDPSSGNKAGEASTVAVAVPDDTDTHQTAAKRQHGKKTKKLKKTAALERLATTTPATADTAPVVNEAGERLDDAGEDTPAFDLTDDEFQRKYFRPYQLPLMTREEDRPMFDTADRDLRILPTAKPIVALSGERLCTVCIEPGHTDKACPELTCEHCGQYERHFSSACPSIDPSPRKPYDWRAEARRQTPAEKRTLRAFCYNCAGLGHYGYDCPRLAGMQQKETSSFSGILAFQYIAPDDELSLAEYDRDTKLPKYPEVASYGKMATPNDMAPLFEPFRVYRQGINARIASHPGSSSYNQGTLSRNGRPQQAFARTRQPRGGGGRGGGYNHRGSGGGGGGSGAGGGGNWSGNYRTNGLPAKPTWHQR